MKTIKFLLIAGFISTAALVYSQTNSEKYNQAEQLIDNFQFDQAISILNDLMASETDNYQFPKSLAYCYLNLLDFDKAIQNYEKAIELNPECIKCYSHLARAHYELGDNDKAWQVVSKGFELSDTTAHLYMTRGLIYQAKKDADNAMFDFTKAIQLDKNNTDYLITRANFYIQTNQVHFAYSDLSDAIKLEPEVAEYYYYRAYILMGLNILDEALLDIDKAISLDQTTADFYNLKFSIHFSRYEYDLAEQSVKKSLEINPDSYMAYINLGDLYFQMNRFDDYCTSYQAALPLIPSDNTDEIENIKNNRLKYCDKNRMPYYFIRALKAYNKSEYQQVIDIVNEGLSIIKKSSVLDNLQASAYIALQDYENAYIYFEKSLQNKEMLESEVVDFYSMQLTPLDIEFVASSYIIKSEFGMAMINLRNHETELAMQRIKASAEMAEKMEDFDGKEFLYNVMSLTYILNSDFDSALKQLEIAKEKNPYYQQTELNRALILLLNSCKYKSKSLEFVFYEPIKSMRMKLPKLKLLKGKNEDLKQALEICNTVINEEPQNAYAYLIKSKILNLLGDQTHKQFADKAVEFGIKDSYSELGIK
ncbi:MAG: tetratricopeptide repeat protein [Bacteroidales bacterium]|nr:tetratricopeptide repeat protein [Bacteroidales bacterium]